MKSQGMYVLVAIAVFGLATQASHAQQAGRVDNIQARLIERFTVADQDKDGWITAAEAEAGMPFVARHFAQIDVKQQGRVSQEDIAAYLATRMAQRGR